MTNRIAAALLELADLVQALALERLVADGQDLVDQQDVGADVDGHREPEAHVPARAVVLDPVVDERLQLGEGDDVVEVALGLPAGQAEDGHAQADVLAAGELAVEAGPSPSSDAIRPRTVTVPVVGARMPDSTLSSVDLLELLGPISSLTVWPAPISSSTSCRPRTPRGSRPAQQQPP